MKKECSDLREMYVELNDLIKIYNTEKENENIKRIIKVIGEIKILGKEIKSELLVDYSKFEELKRLEGHEHWVVKFLETSDGEFVSVSNDRTIKLWDLNTKQCLQTLEGHTEDIYDLIELQDGRLISGGRDCKLKIWDKKIGKCLKNIKVDGMVKKIFELSNDKIVIIYNKTIEVWDIVNEKKIKKIEQTTSEPLAHFEIIRLNNEKFVSSLGSTIKIWDINKDEPEQVLNQDKRHANEIGSMIELSNNKLATGVDDGLIKIWDMDNGECIKTLNGHRGGVCEILNMNKGKLASVGCRDKTVKIWDMNSWECVTIIDEFEDSKSSIQIIKTSNGMLVTRDLSRKIRIWDVESGECLKTINTNNGIVFETFELDDKSIVSGHEDGTIYVWGIKDDEK